MINPFPQLLDLSFFAPTLLRVTVAIALFYLAYQQWQRRSEIIRVRSSTFPALSIIFNLIVGVGLFLGYYTQIVALLAIVGFFIGIWLNRRHSQIVILPNSTVIVLLIVSATLLLTGAGALAMDLPL